MVSFHKVPIDTVWDDVCRLAALHWSETEQYQKYPLNPDKERYFYYNSIGYHHQYVAKDNDLIIGHAGMYVSKSMHTQITIATEDTWYLMPEYRKGRNAIKFYQFIENDMKNLGVIEITMHAKLANGSNRIMEYLKYNFVAKTYMKEIT